MGLERWAEVALIGLWMLDTKDLGLHSMISGKAQMSFKEGSDVICLKKVTGVLEICIGSVHKRDNGGSD